MFGSRNKQKNNNNTLTVNTVKSTSSNNAGHIDTLISEACEIKGDIKSEKSIKIDGLILGNVEAKGTVVISSSGKVTGEVVTDTLVVYGNLLGNSKTQVIHIQDGGHIEGNIDTQRLHVELEATYNGQVSMNPPKKADVPAITNRPQDKPQDKVVPPNAKDTSKAVAKKAAS